VATPVVRTSPARSKMPAYDSVPNAANTSIRATIIPKSPMRLTTNAFLAAPAAESRVNQKPMSR